MGAVVKGYSSLDRWGEETGVLDTSENLGLSKRRGVSVLLGSAWCKMVQGQGGKAHL